MNKQTNPTPDNAQFESDIQKLVHRHLSDPNHVFTDEELASIRIGVNPPTDTPIHNDSQGGGLSGKG